MYSIDSDTIESRQNDGAHVTVTYRLIVFQLYAGEVLVGKVVAFDPSGMLVSVNFFDQIFVPAANLQQPSVFNAKEKAWMWQFQDNEIFLDLHDTVRVRVTSVQYAALRRTGDEQPPDKPNSLLADREVPMRVFASMHEDGLGNVAWWADEGEEGERVVPESVEEEVEEDGERLQGKHDDDNLYEEGYEDPEKDLIDEPKFGRKDDMSD